LKYADEHWPVIKPEPVLEIDAELEEQDITLDCYDDIAALEPFGQGNPKPLFVIRTARVAWYKLVGAAKQHLQLQVMVGEQPLDCIGFSMAHLAGKLGQGSSIALAGELMADSWSGTKKLKMRIIDILIEEPELAVAEPAPAEERLMPQGI